MKKLLLAVPLITLLAACCDDNEELKIKRSFSPSEKALITTYYKKGGNQYHDYKATIDKLYNSRYNSEERKWTTDFDKVFCDALPEIRMDEMSMSTSNSRDSSLRISTVFHQSRGMTLEQACDVVPEKDKVVAETPEEQIVVDKETHLIDIKLYDETIKVSKGCKRAETKIMQLTESGEGITKDNYNDIAKAVIRCKVFELEKELNQ